MASTSADVSVSSDCSTLSIDLMKNPYYVVCTRPIAIVNDESTSAESVVCTLTENVVVEDLDARDNIREVMEEEDDLAEVFGPDDEAVEFLQKPEGLFSNLAIEDFEDPCIYGDPLPGDEYESDDGDDIAPDPRWINLDPKLVADVKAGGRRKSIHSENWAKNTFNAWRKAFNHDDSLSIEDLSEENPKLLVQLLSTFMLQVAKGNGDLYPPLSLQSLLRAFGRIIRARIAANAIKTGKSGHKFRIISDDVYAEVKVACDRAIQRSVEAGLGKEVQKSDILTPTQEQMMLAQAKCQIDTPQGINLRFGYFCTRNFIIRGASELRKTMGSEFTLHCDEFGEFIRYQAGESKNYKYTSEHCAPEDFRPPVHCYVPDVVQTYKCLIEHRPIFDDGVHHPLFLGPKHKLNPRKDKVWFLKTPVGKNTLGLFSKHLTEDIPELEGKKITNKSGRGTAISRLSGALVPMEAGMKITGHRNPKSYQKYDQTDRGVTGRAMQRIISGEDITYEQAILEENQRVKRIKSAESCAVSMVVELPKHEENKENTMVIAPSKAISGSVLEAPSKMYEESGLPMSWWNSPESAALLQSCMRQSSSQNNKVTSVGCHQFGNLTNCTITLQVGDAGSAATLLKALQGPECNEEK